MEMEFKTPFLLSIIPEKLLDKEKALATLKQARSSEHIRPFITSLQKEDAKCQQLHQKYLDKKRVLEEEIKQLSIETECIKKKVYEKDLELHTIKSKVSSLRQHLSTVNKPFCDEDLSELVNKLSSLKEGIGKEKSALKNEMDNFRRGVLFYEKYLNCKVMLNSKDSLIITFDKSSKSPSEVKEFLKFDILDDGLNFRFVEMQPKVKGEQTLVKTLDETGDLQGFIVSYWRLTKKMNLKNVLCEKNSI